MNKLFRLLFTLSFLLFSFLCKAQLTGQAFLDSLITVLETAQEDTNKINLLDEICFEYKSINPDEGIKYGMQQLELSQKLNWQQGIAKSYSRLGSNYIFKADYPQALEFDLKALKVYESINDTTGIATILGNIGNVYQRQKEFPKALDYYLKALKINEELQYKKGIALNLGNIGLLYSGQRDYDKALDYFLKAVKMNDELGNKNAVAIIYGNMGNAYKKKNDYSKALEYFKNAYSIADTIGDKNGMSRYLGNIGGAYLDIALDSSFFNGTKKNEFGTKASVLNLAIAYTDSSIAIKKEIGELDGLFRKYDDLSHIYELLGDNKKALESHRNYTLFKDSVFNMEKDKKITETAMQYEFDKKQAAAKAEQEKKDIEQRNIRNSITAGFTGSLIFLVVVYRQRNKISKARKRSDELLLNILPSEVADELKVKGRAEAKQFDEVTVMFTDFKGFTKISENLSPAELVTEIHNCFRAFDAIIGKYKIEKIKTIGDSYMCAGGLPVTNSSHAEDVVNAALEIQKLMNDDFKTSPLMMFGGARIGIHTGPVVAGIVGIKKFAYDIWGDTVNIASRMESSGEAGKVNISGSTYELVKNTFNCIHRGKIQAKNKGEIDMYFVNQ